MVFLREFSWKFVALFGLVSYNDPCNSAVYDPLYISLVKLARKITRIYFTPKGSESNREFRNGDPGYFREIFRLNGNYLTNHSKDPYETTSKSMESLRPLPHL